MLCIFCLKERPASQEHVFPEAIGGTLTIERVCEKCNGRLNQRADLGVTRYPLVRMTRARLRIPDRRGKVIDLFADFFGKGTIVGGDPGQEVDVRYDPLTDRPALRLLPQKTEKIGPDGKREFQIKIDARDVDKLPLMIKRARKRAGLPERCGSGAAGGQPIRADLRPDAWRLR